MTEEPHDYWNPCSGTLRRHIDGLKRRAGKQLLPRIMLSFCVRHTPASWGVPGPSMREIFTFGVHAAKGAVAALRSALEPLPRQAPDPATRGTFASP